MSDQRASVGDVIQIDPEHDDMFGGCFGIVAEVSDWGCNLVACPAPGMEGIAYYRVKHGAYAVIGKAIWVIGPKEDADEEEGQAESAG